MAEIFHDPAAHRGVHAAYVLLQKCRGKGADGIPLSVGGADIHQHPCHRADAGNP